MKAWNEHQHLPTYATILPSYRMDVEYIEDRQARMIANEQARMARDDDRFEFTTGPDAHLRVKRKKGAA